MYVTAELNLGEILYPLIGASVLVGAAVALAVKDASPNGKIYSSGWVLHKKKTEAEVK